MNKQTEYSIISSLSELIPAAKELTSLADNVYSLQRWITITITDKKLVVVVVVCSVLKKLCGRISMFTSRDKFS